MSQARGSRYRDDPLFLSLASYFDLVVDHVCSREDEEVSTLTDILIVNNVSLSECLKSFSSIFSLIPKSHTYFYKD